MAGGTVFMVVFGVSRADGAGRKGRKKRQYRGWGERSRNSSKGAGTVHSRAVSGTDLDSSGSLPLHSPTSAWLGTNPSDPEKARTPQGFPGPESGPGKPAVAEQYLPSRNHFCSWAQFLEVDSKDVSGNVGVWVGANPYHRRDAKYLLPAWAPCGLTIYPT